MRLISLRKGFNLIENLNLGSLWSANDPLLLISADPLTSLKYNADIFEILSFANPCKFSLQLGSKYVYLNFILGNERLCEQSNYRELLNTEIVFKILTVRQMLMEGRSRKIMGTKAKFNTDVVILAGVGIEVGVRQHG